jgi:hypothetical protein
MAITAKAPPSIICRVGPKGFVAGALVVSNASGLLESLLSSN